MRSTSPFQLLKSPMSEIEVYSFGAWSLSLVHVYFMVVMSMVKV